MKNRFRLGHAAIDSVSRAEALQILLTFARSQPCRFAVTPNSDHIVMLEDQPALRSVYETAHLVVADGMPLVWASYVLGQKLPGRVTGSELMPLLCAEAAKQGLRIFLLGAGPGVANQARQRLQQQFPGLTIVGTHCPPLGFESDPVEGDRILTLLRAARPDIVFVGLGAPKQEFWMYQNYQKLDGGILLGIGAAIDFSAGIVQRAPFWMQRLGAEWLFRWLQEPRRLSGRYLRDTRIFWIILRQWWQKSRFKP